MFSKSKGVSEVLGALIVAAIAIAAASAYYFYYTHYISHATESLKAQLQTGIKAVQQDVSLVHDYKGTGSEWWNMSYTKKRPLIINNSGNPNTLYNYPKNITVNYDSDMQSDFSDVKFMWFNSTSGQFQEMTTQLLEKVDGSYAKYKVYFPVIAAYTYYSASNTTSWIYYGVSG